MGDCKIGYWHDPRAGQRWAGMATKRVREIEQVIMLRHDGGPCDTDDGDVLTGWALSGRGIINKPRFEVEPFIRDQRLKVILAKTPPTPVQFAAVYPHKKLQDPKVRLLLDFMAERCQRLIKDILAGK